MFQHPVDKVGYLTHISNMSPIDRLLAVADAYIAQTGSRPTTVSLHAFGHMTKLAALRPSRDSQVRLADASFQRFAINGPDGQALSVILFEGRQTNFPQSLQRPPALSQNLSDGPGGGGGGA